MGVADRLEAWRTVVEEMNGAYKTLDAWAQSNPTWEDVVSLSRQLAVRFVARGDFWIQRHDSIDKRDMQRENVLLRVQLFLLYEELSFGMNEGDTGRVEVCLPAWIAVFKATGKHKYAKQMARFLSDVHFVYPEGLRKAIRYNILSNPTGKPHHFRAIDWLVEWNDLFTKVLPFS